MAEPRQGHRVQAIAAFVLFFILFFTGLAPFALEMPFAGMEGSWIDASVYAGLHRLAYGTQFVFTNGPLFPLYHREYAGPVTLYYVLARFVVVVYLAYGFARLSPGSWFPFIIAAIFLWPGIVLLPNDTLLLVVPLLTALLAFANKAGWKTLAAGVVLSAALGLAKVSIIPFSLGAFVLVDTMLIQRRKLPLSVLGYILGTWALFIVSGQSSTQFWAFLAGSYEMTAGYSAALSIDGPSLELIGWLAVAALILVALIVKRAGVLRVLLVAGYLFIAFKAGFVRHDTHSFAAWGCVLFLLALLGLPGTLPRWRPRTAILAYTLPVLVFGAAFAYSARIPSYWKAVTTQSETDLRSQIGHLAAFISSPSAWLAEQDRRAAEAYAVIRAGQPLPPLTGTIDAISNIQSAVTAAGLDYTPRPTVQENMTFSPTLIARNRAFLEGHEAPQTLLFAPGATDNRHPASVEGSLWPLLLSRYEVTSRAGDQLILTRRATPQALAFSAPQTVDTTFGANLDLLSGTSPLFLQLDIRETLAGKLIDQAFKPPQVSLVVTYGDGATETYRLIPLMIHEGMVVSPTIATIDDYEKLAKGADLSGLRFPTSIRVETTGPWAYEPKIVATFTTLSVPPN